MTKTQNGGIIRCFVDVRINRNNVTSGGVKIYIKNPPSKNRKSDPKSSCSPERIEYWRKKVRNINPRKIVPTIKSHVIRKIFHFSNDSTTISIT